MIIRLVDRRDQALPAGWVAPPEELLHRLVASLGLPTWALDLVLVSDPVMARLNADFRHRAAVTDVLSFSYLLEQGTGPCDLAAGRGGAHGDLWLDPLTRATAAPGEPLGIGEVIVAPDFVTHRCRERNWPLEQELPLLVVHGALHLLGWDHEDPDEAAAMRNLEVEMLAGVGLEHPLQPGGRLEP